MANIKIDELKPVGIELFADSESFMNEINENDVNYIKGGGATMACTFVANCNQ